MLSKPHNLDQMLKVTEEIAEPFIFFRVDLYNNNGEIKFYPSISIQQFSSEESNLMLSNWLNVT